MATAKKPAATAAAVAEAVAWSDVDATARMLEGQEGQYGARVTQITTTGDVPPEGLWHGTYGNATVAAGDTTVISLSDGRKFDAAGGEIAQEAA